MLLEQLNSGLAVRRQDEAISLLQQRQLDQFSSDWGIVDD
jgi:hypothetical protein